ncbi:RlpA-like double-psi beta-barrel-protein domain-containing protein-containing protein [Syncephalis plumigaleata]|nr:RlpA-like double-psi beta-barrel-protein domain-containing protein-containing protein [Syncephalis plumigaleata]
MLHLPSSISTINAMQFFVIIHSNHHLILIGTHNNIFSPNTFKFNIYWNSLGNLHATTHQFIQTRFHSLNYNLNMRFFNPTIVALVVTITGFMATTTDAASTPINIGRATMRKADHHQRRLVTRSDRATWFTPSKDACLNANTKPGHEISSSSTDMIAALSKDLYGDLNKKSGYCGKCAHVKGPEGSVVVKITDACPKCEEHSLDLTKSAFERIAPTGAGDVPIQWTFGPCN